MLLVVRPGAPSSILAPSSSWPLRRTEQEQRKLRTSQKNLTRRTEAPASSPWPPQRCSASSRPPTSSKAGKLPPWAEPASARARKGGGTGLCGVWTAKWFLMSKGHRYERSKDTTNGAPGLTTSNKDATSNKCIASSNKCLTTTVATRTPLVAFCNVPVFWSTVLRSSTRWSRIENLVFGPAKNGFEEKVVIGKYTVRGVHKPP